MPDTMVFYMGDIWAEFVTTGRWIDFNPEVTAELIIGEIDTGEKPGQGGSFASCSFS